jgi:ubiquinone/menaquinone biosynthesis C-methylase UbiE
MVKPVILDETTVREFAAYMKRFPELYAHLAQMLKRRVSVSHPLILDLGAGPGLLSAEILRQIPDATVVAVDPLETMLDLACTQAKQVVGGTFTAVQGVSERIPLKDRSFDGIISRFSLPYWPQPEESFQEMHRVLKPGGIVVLEELNNDFPRWKLSLLKVRMRTRGAGRNVANYHVEAYPQAHTIEQVQQFFMSNGFFVVETEGTRIEWRFIVVAQKT